MASVPVTDALVALPNVASTEDPLQDLPDCLPDMGSTIDVMDFLADMSMGVPDDDVLEDVPPCQPTQRGPKRRSDHGEAGCDMHQYPQSAARTRVVDCTGQSSQMGDVDCASEDNTAIHTEEVQAIRTLTKTQRASRESALAHAGLAVVCAQLPGIMADAHICTIGVHLLKAINNQLLWN